MVQNSGAGIEAPKEGDMGTPDGGTMEGGHIGLGIRESEGGDMEPEHTSVQCHCRAGVAAVPIPIHNAKVFRHSKSIPNMRMC